MLGTDSLHTMESITSTGRYFAPKPPSVLINDSFAANKKTKMQLIFVIDRTSTIFFTIIRLIQSIDGFEYI